MHVSIISDALWQVDSLNGDLAAERSSGQKCENARQQLERQNKVRLSSQRPRRPGGLLPEAEGTSWSPPRGCGDLVSRLNISAGFKG